MHSRIGNSTYEPPSFATPASSLNSLVVAPLSVVVGLVMESAGLECRPDAAAARLLNLRNAREMNVHRALGETGGGAADRSTRSATLSTVEKLGEAVDSQRETRVESRVEARDVSRVDVRVEARVEHRDARAYGERSTMISGTALVRSIAAGWSIGVAGIFFESPLLRERRLPRIPNRIVHRTAQSMRADAQG